MLAMVGQVKNIRDIVWPLLQRELRDVKIVAVNVRRDVDGDGDPVLFITVVFDDRAKRLDTKVMTSMVRRVRPKLQEAGEDGFPVFTYLGRSELGKIRPDAA